MDKAVAVFSIIGGVANIAMAVAAVWALRAWKKQIAGASHHELAKKLSGALRQVAIVRARTLENLSWFRAEGDEPTLTMSKAMAGTSLEGDAASLRAASEELQALEGQVAVQWGDAMLDLVEVIRYESGLLAVVADLELRPEIREAPAVQIAFSSPRKLGVSFTGTVFEKALTKYTALAQEWLRFHVGRDGASEMSEEELRSRRANIDAEVARLTETERHALERDEAKRAKLATSASGPSERGPAQAEPETS